MALIFNLKHPVCSKENKTIINIINSIIDLLYIKIRAYTTDIAFIGICSNLSE